MQRFLKRKPLLAFDFDGTLAPFADDPGKVRTVPTIAQDLSKLGREFKLAVVSGRGVNDLKRRLNFRPDFVVGNHGLEGVRAFRAKSARAKKESRAWVRWLEPRLAEIAEGDEGVFLEDKTYSLSIHFRKGRNKKRIAERLKSSIKRLKPKPRIVPGRDLLNLVPRNSPNKGHAVKQLLSDSGLKSVLFVGDDRTDEDAFSLKSRNVLCVRVGRSKDSLAKYFVKDLKEMDRLFKLALEAIE